MMDKQLADLINKHLDHGPPVLPASYAGFEVEVQCCKSPNGGDLHRPDCEYIELVTKMVALGLRDPNKDNFRIFSLCASCYEQSTFQDNLLIGEICIWCD